MNAKTIIVTGAAGSLGSALSLACAREGLNTVMLDSDRDGLERAYDRITESGLPDPALYPIDMAAAGPDNYDELLVAIESEFGGLDSVVHCAARFEGLTPLEQIAPEEWLMQVQVNLNAAWLLSVKSLRLLRQSESAHLYFMLEDLRRVEGAFWGAYGICKHALRALASQLSSECRSSGVQVLGINPGPMRSELRSRAYHAESPDTQPDPMPLAKQILEYLEGKSRPDGIFVELDHQR